MSLRGLCELAARENIRLRWRCRMNGAQTMYRIELLADWGAHTGQRWIEPYRTYKPLSVALDEFSWTLLGFFTAEIERRRGLAA